MPIESRIKYDPTLSVEENAKINGVSVSAIRYFIRTRGIDRRYDVKAKVLEGMQAYIDEHPEATKAELQKATGHSINTIRRYWEVLHGFETLPTNKHKEDIRGKEKVVSHKRHIAYLDKLPIEFIREYLLQREAQEDAQKTAIAKSDIVNPKSVSVEVPLTAEDLSSEEQSKRAATMLLNRAKHKAQGKNVILDGVEIKYEKRSYPISDVVLYSSKVEPKNRMLGHHYECLITFRGVEFYGVEQMHSALKFNERPYILNDIMTADSGVQAKSRSHKYADMYLYDSDYNLKDARITALCFLFKYLSVKEYRDRMRELRGKTLFENKGSYEGGNRMNEDKTMLIGNNGDGRSMMAVRDMMLKYEDEAIAEAEQKKGCSLTDTERDEVLNGVLVAVRRKFESDPQVKADSDNVIEYIKTHNDIIPLKRYWPGENAKAIIVEFDNCVFDTSADDEVRKAKGAKITNWNKFYKEYIPKYRLHNGWRKVFEWADANGVLIGVLGKAKTDLVRRTFETNGIRYNAIEYASNASRQHAYDIIDGLKVRPEQVLCYISGSKQGVKQAKEGGFRFMGATWDATDTSCFNGLDTIASPNDIISKLSFAKR